MSIEGIRVVRGPDWHYGDDDGGEGHVGTVTQDNQDKTVEVQWDMGNNGCYNTGNGGKCDLRVFDSCPAGLKNVGITCDNCMTDSFTGTRWKCQTCDDYDLCNVCYKDNKHELQHPFLRISVPGGKGIAVSKRSQSKKMKPYGLFPGAKVKRGIDWNYGNQDGGEGQIGTVTAIKNYGSRGHERDCVAVKWPTNDGIYRVGYRGKVDLLCVEAAGGTHYYNDHLYVLNTSPDVKSASFRRQPPPSLSTVRCEKTGLPSIQLGDKVCVCLPDIALKEVQRGHGGWSMRMGDYIGRQGTVKKFEDNGDVLVEYDDKEYRYNVCAIIKIPSLKVGDVVKIIDNEKKVKVMQKSHGGWQAEMASVLGKVGKVVKIDSDGDVAVAFGEVAFVFNPACCEIASGTKVTELKVVEERKSRPGTGAGGGASNDDDDGKDAAVALGHLIAKMMILRELSKASLGPQHLVGASANNDIVTVGRILKDKPDLINEKHQGLTALILSSHEGHKEIVQLLLKSGADTNLTEAKGNNALMAALMKKHEDIASWILNAGVNIDAENMFGRTALHCAATNGCLTILKRLLDRVADPNAQDNEGDTPLHDAIRTKFTAGVEALVASSKINLKVTNKKGHPPLHLAAMIDHESAVSSILKKSPDLVNFKKNDGFTALHIAAVNDNTDVINTLIKFKATVDAQNNNTNSALHLAAHQGYLNSTKALVQAGANVNLQDGDGDTALHLCVTGSRQAGSAAVLAQLLLGVQATNEAEIRERTNLACFLIQNGGSVDIRNKKNKDVLRSCRDEKMTNALRMFAAKHGRPATAAGGRRRMTLAEAFEQLALPCMVCMERMADARFAPCGHKVCCQGCCFAVSDCPMCYEPIDERFNLNGQQLQPQIQCKVQ